MSNVSKCFLCANKNDYDPKFGYYGCNFSGHECKGYSMFAPKVKPKRETHYDRLIRKTPEEMAEKIGESIDCEVCKTMHHSESGECPCRPHQSCVDFWIDWLKQEATDGKTD